MSRAVGIPAVYGGEDVNTFTSEIEKRTRRRGTTRLSAKNQATIPVEALRKAGDELRVEAAGPGRVVLVRTDDVITRYAGSMPGVYPRGYLERLRLEWRY